MTSEAQLGQEAVDLAQQTSWTWDKFLNEIRTNKDYAYKTTTWYKAGGKLEQAKHLSPPPQPMADLSSVRGRIFLAQSPLDCMVAPEWMVPVCTADQGYRDWYSPQVVAELRDRFGTVEAWCDCRNPTPFSATEQMALELGLDGVWGQCENQGEFDHAYASGSRRMIGNITALNESSKAEVAKAEVLLSVELYRNVMPWMYPDWQGANAGIGGNCIACYASESEGAAYTPVRAYKDIGLYVPHNDSVYGVGLTHQDWLDLA